MIVIGQKYNFTNVEKASIEKDGTSIYTIKQKKDGHEQTIADIQAHLQDNNIDIVILNTKKKTHDSVVRYLTHLQLERNIKIYTMEHYLEEVFHKCYVEENNQNIDFLGDLKRYTKWQYFQKRCVDYFGIFWLSLFAFPIMIYAAYKIKKQSPGSIFFMQDRVGMDGKTFKCIKFRSMHEKTEYFNHYTQDNDPRIFPWGNFMRKTRIDELPQIINILKGEMHLIGPRAEWNELVEQYEEPIPFYSYRHLVAPGVTGWAQVRYPYGANMDDTRQKLMYDFYYIKYWSILLELKIVWRTAMTVIGRRGL